MQIRSNDLNSSITVKRSILFLFVFVVCAAALWVVLRTGQPRRDSAPADVAKVDPPRGQDVSESSPAPTPQASGSLEPVPVVAPATAPDGGEKISAIIANPSLDFPSAVVRLLEILPGLTETEQAEAAQHIANLSDEKSAAQWSAMLVANQLPPAAGEVLFNDLLNRPHDLTMPALAAMADQPFHPKTKDSIAILDVLYGQPPQGRKWAAFVKEKLAEAPR